MSLLDTYQAHPSGITDTFTHPCIDCGRQIRVVNGRERRHWCRMPRRLRGKIGEAWADGYDWGRRDIGDAALLAGV